MSDLHEEFSYPRPNVIVSSSGFTVEIRPRSSILYSEGDRITDIFAELLVGDEPRIVVRRADVRSWQGDEGNPFTEAERARIIHNIQRAAAFRKWTVDVE